MKDKYYLDYRTGAIVKNLDISTLAPEVYIEVVANDTLDGMYKYRFEDSNKQILDFSFSRKNMQDPNWDFFTAAENHCIFHNFVKTHTTMRVLYISEKDFNDLKE